MCFEFKLADANDCHKLSILKKEIWESTYRGIYADEVLDSYDYKYHEEKFAKKISSDEEVYLIFKEEEVIGYFSFGKPSYGYKNYQNSLNSLYILKEYQGMGVGSQVFEYLREYCLQQGITSFFTCCNMYNMQAFNFYLKMGGVQTDYENFSPDKAAHQYYIEFLNLNKNKSRRI